MPETDTYIRYGFICENKAGDLPETPPEEFSLRVFEKGEDSQWRTGVLMSRAKRAGRSFRGLFTDELMADIETRAARAREEGKVPLRVAGPPESVTGFMAKIGVEPADLML